VRKLELAFGELISEKIKQGGENMKKEVQFVRGRNTKQGAFRI